MSSNSELAPISILSSEVTLTLSNEIELTVIPSLALVSRARTNSEFKLLILSFNRQPVGFVYVKFRLFHHIKAKL